MKWLVPIIRQGHVIISRHIGLDVIRTKQCHHDNNRYALLFQKGNHLYVITSLSARWLHKLHILPTFSQGGIADQSRWVESVHYEYAPLIVGDYTTAQLNAIPPVAPQLIELTRVESVRVTACRAPSSTDLT